MLSLPLLLTLAAAETGVEASLLQYGAVGVLALLLLIAVRILFARQNEVHDREIARLQATVDEERLRSERSDEQLTRLNELIREQIIPVFTRATDTLSRATDTLARTAEIMGRAAEIIADFSREERRPR